MAGVGAVVGEMALKRKSTASTCDEGTPLSKWSSWKFLIKRQVLILSAWIYDVNKYIPKAINRNKKR